MNTNKTKILANSAKCKVNDENIEYVDEYIYLGHLISTADCNGKEIQRRVTKTWKRYWSLKEVTKNKHIKLKHKRKVFNTRILPCLSYACQTWAITNKRLNKLNVRQNSIERSVLGVKLKDKITVKHDKEITKCYNVTNTIRTQKWRWTGHMIREKEKWSRLVRD